MYRAVFSDVDGTLINSRHTVTPATVRAVKAVMDKGIPFVIVSGRSPDGIYTVERQMGISCPVICYSGGLIIDENGKILHNEGLSRGDAARIIGYIGESGFDLTWVIYTADKWLVRDRSDPRVVEEERIVKAVSTQGTWESLSEDETVNKILCICEKRDVPDTEKRFRERFPEFTVVRSGEKLIDIMPAGVNKAKAAEKLCALWGMEMKDIIAFGDNYNDMELLEAAGHGVLMGNAPAELRQRFSRVTLDCDSDGIAAELKMLFDIDA